MEVNKPFNIYIYIYLFRGVGDLIPYEEKWKLINQSTYLFEGGDLIPWEEKWKLINHSTYLFRGGGFDPLGREVEVNKPFNKFVRRGGWI